MEKGHASSRPLCTICVRKGSKGVKNKNIRLLAGKPLLAHSILQARESGLFRHVIVSTDSDKITQIAEQYGAEVFFRRPAELAADTTAKLPVIRHALLESEKHFGQEFPTVVDLDATSPLRSADDIAQALRSFVENDYDNLVTATSARRSPYFNLIELTSDDRVILSKEADESIYRRQDSPRCFDMNASIYIWKRKALLERNSLFLEKTGLHVMPEERSVDIDSELDFKIVELIMRERVKP